VKSGVLWSRQAAPASTDDEDFDTKRVESHHPVLLGWSPYGKHGLKNLGMMPGADVDASWISKHLDYFDLGGEAGPPNQVGDTPTTSTRQGSLLTLRVRRVALGSAGAVRHRATRRKPVRARHVQPSDTIPWQYYDAETQWMRELRDIGSGEAST
jgi:hypothetical protein